MWRIGHQKIRENEISEELKSSVIQDKVNPRIFQRRQVRPDLLLVVFENEFRSCSLGILFHCLKVANVFFRHMGEEGQILNYGSNHGQCPSVASWA